MTALKRMISATVQATKVALFFLMMSCCSTPEAEKSSEERAIKKLAVLEAKVKLAESRGLDVLKEKMTIRTAELFLKYADWDEKHTERNKELFEKVAAYKDSALMMAKLLPEFERKEVVLMLDESIGFINKLISGKVSRAPIPDIDWSEVTFENNQLSFSGRPVFLSNYTWKPKTPELTEYHGHLDGFFLRHNYVEDEQGTINEDIAAQLKNKPSGNAGFIFLNHKGNVPNWAKEKYGAGLVMREDTYTSYDIDNPGAREMNRLLLSETVPYMAGKKYSMLGYMLCNEPHFYTTKDVWATGPVSEFTMTKFRNWLTKKHKTIKELNELWETNFSGFNTVQLEVPIAQNMQGTPEWFDWVSFNMDRVTDWYRFLQSTIHASDPEGKVHLKVMPNLWTDNKRNHGIDMEAITRMTEIIGNDAGAAYNYMWGDYDWDQRYAFDWREMAMGHDFYKSVSPEKVMFNSETHFLSTGKSRDLYMNPKYARATYWLATTQGMNVSQTWFWSRNPDGSPFARTGKGYGGSNNQQPRIVNEVASTIMDLNAHAETITKMQRQRKPIRIFYSKTSAITKPDHMDDVFELYESLYFEGTPLGFVTEGIFKERSSSDWDIVLIRKTPFVTQQELSEIQLYLDGGGTVLIDRESLQKDEYGRPIPKLEQGKGHIMVLDHLEDFRERAFDVLKSKRTNPELNLREENESGIKGCTWKCVKEDDGSYVVSVVNVGKTTAKLSISLSDTTDVPKLTNLLDGTRINHPLLAPYEMLFIKVSN